MIPGVPNLHSHAFQRAMAGGAERRSPAGQDSFWTWRDTMYRFVGLLSPEDAEAIAAQLYVELLEWGFTGIAEFHYLHHQPDGTPYADIARDGAAAPGGGAADRDRHHPAAQPLSPWRHLRPPTRCRGSGAS